MINSPIKVEINQLKRIELFRFSIKVSITPIKSLVFKKGRMKNILVLQIILWMRYL